MIENPEKFFKDGQKAYILFYQKKWIYEKQKPHECEAVQIKVNIEGAKPKQEAAKPKRK